MYIYVIFLLFLDYKLFIQTCNVLFHVCLSDKHVFPKCLKYVWPLKILNNK